MSNGGLRTLYFVLGYFLGGLFCTLIASKSDGWYAALAMVLVGVGMTFAASPWRDIEDELAPAQGGGNRE